LTPGAKAIALLRDPVERACSSDSMALILREKNENTNFIEALGSEPIASNDPWDGERRLIRMGLYSLHLQRYYDAIGADRI
jgi:hypothetical protein